MIRVVLAVVLATALIGVSLPAIDDARRDHTETVVRAELTQVERAATDLLQTDDPADDGARRVVTVRFPTKSWTDAGVDDVTMAASQDGSGGRFTWTVEGGPERVRPVPEIPLRTADGDPLRLAESGRHRLVLTLDGNRTAPVVTVRRFTSDEGASRVHATVASRPGRGTGRRMRVRARVRR